MNVELLKDLVKSSDTIFDIMLFSNVLEMDLSNFDISGLHAKVAYEDWIVCYYQKDDKFYLFNFDDNSIREVELINGFILDDAFVAIDDDGNMIDDDALPDYYPCTVCGEVDDMSAYVYFQVINKKRC